MLWTWSALAVKQALWKTWTVGVRGARTWKGVAQWTNTVSGIPQTCQTFIVQSPLTFCFISFFTSFQRIRMQVQRFSRCLGTIAFTTLILKLNVVRNALLYLFWAMLNNRWLVLRQMSCLMGKYTRRFLIATLHNIVPTHLFILHINQQAYFMERNRIYLYLENYSTYKHRTNTSM